MMTTVLTESHSYLQLAAAFCRGRLGLTLDVEDSDAVAAGVRAGLRLHKFKRNAELPRVRRVLGAVAAFAPASLLDVGSGRGTFLWPLLDAFPALTVIAIDQSAQRASDLACVGRGGHAPLRAARMDATRLALASRSLDGVTALERRSGRVSELRKYPSRARDCSRAITISPPFRSPRSRTNTSSSKRRSTGPTRRSLSRSHRTKRARHPGCRAADTSSPEVHASATSSCSRAGPRATPRRCTPRSGHAT